MHHELAEQGPPSLQNPFLIQKSRDEVRQEREAIRENDRTEARRPLRERTMSKQRHLMRPPSDRKIMNDYMMPAMDVARRPDPLARSVKREVFNANLLIGCHETEIGRMRGQREVAEAQLADREAEVELAGQRADVSAAQYADLEERERFRLKDQRVMRGSLEERVRKQERENHRLEGQLRELDVTVGLSRFLGGILDRMEKALGHRPRDVDEFLGFFKGREDDLRLMVEASQDQSPYNYEEMARIAAVAAVLERNISDADGDLCRHGKAGQAVAGRARSAALDDVEGRVADLTHRLTSLYRELNPGRSVPEGPLAVLEAMEKELVELRRRAAAMDKKDVSQRERAQRKELRALQRAEKFRQRDEALRLRQKFVSEGGSRLMKRTDCRPLRPRTVPYKEKRVAEEDAERIEAMERLRVEDLLYGPELPAT